MTKNTFNINDFVVYPTHGVGKITDINSQVLAERNIEFYSIFFERENMKLSVPIARADKIGLRALCCEADIEKAFDIISEKAQTSRGIMWSRRAQEYERKINSGDIFALAEVIRDLHRNVKNPDRSYSERMIYESAFNRFVSEATIIKQQDRELFEEDFYKMLKIEDVDLLEEIDHDVEDQEEIFEDEDSDDDVMVA